MRKYIKNALKKVYLDNVAIELLHGGGRILWHLKRKFGRVDHGIIETYVSANEIRKLHIGCGGHILDGWLNADIFPSSSIILHLDATEPFPLGDEEFDYVFSEHMIEHISYSHGLLMLSECYRILRKHGKIRISTPDLSFLINMYKWEKSDLQKEYIKWATDNIKYAQYSGDTFVINKFVRDWGHQFIYDEKTLRASMEKVGFTRVTRCELNKSEDEVLRNLENEKRLPNGFLRLETFTLEGTKLSTS